MSRRHSIACALLCYVACAAAARGEIIKDRRNDLQLAPLYINVIVDEFHGGGLSPTTWFALDGALSPYHPDQTRLSLGLPQGELSGRSSFWVPRVQPTFYLEGYAPPFPEPDLGDRGLTFHSIDVEALAGADVVIVDPSNVPGRFTYSVPGGGSRTVDLSVLSRTPEPGAAALALVAFAPLLRRRRR